MKRVSVIVLLTLTVAALLAAGCCRSADNIIETKVPAQPAGQQDAIGLTAEPLDTVRIGVVGLGMRGSDAVERLSLVPGAVVTALCDLLPGRVDASAAALARMGKHVAIEVPAALDMDVYDLAEWCCVAPLSRLSLENGSMPVAVPDFTRGAWDRVQGFHYALEEE